MKRKKGSGEDGGIRPFYRLEPAFWNIHSATWDDKLLLPEYREHLEAAVNWFAQYRAGDENRVLDIGCGTGNYSIELARRGFQVEGIDFASRMLKRARAKAQRSALKVRFSLVDFNKALPFPSHSFHYVVCAATLQCVKEPLRFLHKISDVLVPSGIFLVVAISPHLRSTIPGKASLWRRISWRIKPIFKAAKRIRRYRREELVDMLRASRFNILEEATAKDQSMRFLTRAHE